MEIQPETPDLRQAVRNVHLDAFPSAIEADLVERLRRDGDALISLVALDGEAVVGHVMFSPVTAPLKALSLGPLAVMADRQRQGIGGRLVRDGLDRARTGGWDAVFVQGDPAYYRRFGFSVADAEGFASPYAGPYFMVLSLGTALPVRGGRIDYARAFDQLEEGR